MAFCTASDTDGVPVDEFHGAVGGVAVVTPVESVEVSPSLPS